MRVGLDFALLCDWDEEENDARLSFLENRPVATSLACLEELASTLGQDSVFVVINNSSSSRARKWIDFRNLWSLGLAKEGVLVGLDAAAAANLDFFLSADQSALTFLSQGKGKQTTILCLFQRFRASSTLQHTQEVHPWIRPVYDINRPKSERGGMDAGGDLSEQWSRCMQIIADEGCPQLRLRPFDTWMDPSLGPSSSLLPSSASTISSSSSSYSSSSSAAHSRRARRPRRQTGHVPRSSSSPSSCCCFCGEESEVDCSLCVLDRDLQGRPVTLFRVLRGMFIREADERDDEDEGGPVEQIHLHLQDHGGGLVYDSTSWSWWDLYTHFWSDGEGSDPRTADVVQQKRAMQ